jgi:hypothetical protein
MITLAEAITVAERYVHDMERGSEVPLKLLQDLTIERRFGWAFFYDAVLPPGADDSDTTLAGNSPIIIDKRDGSIHVTGTAYPIEYYLDNFERTGSPYSE